MGVQDQEIQSTLSKTTLTPANIWILKPWSTWKNRRRGQGMYEDIALQLHSKIILRSFTQSFSKYMYYHSLCRFGAEERKILRWSENYWAHSSVVTSVYWQMPICLSMVLLKFCLWKKWHNGLERIYWTVRYY